MPKPHRYAEKACREARINGRTMEGKQLDPDHRALDRLKVAALNATGSFSGDIPNPAEYVRGYAHFAEARLSGEVKTIASVGEIAASKGVLAALIRMKKGIA